MSEHELLQENERLRRELDAANKSRERLRELVCALFPVESPEVMEKQVEEMMRRPRKGIDDIIAELSGDETGSPRKDQPIPA